MNSITEKVTLLTTLSSMPQKETSTRCTISFSDNLFHNSSITKSKAMSLSDYPF